MKIQKPKIPAQLFHDKILEEEIALYNREELTIQDCLFENQYYEYLKGSHIEIESCHFTNCQFRDCDFTKINFTDVIFDNCDFSNALLNEAVFHRTQWQQCKLVGSNLEGAFIRNSIFTECNCSYLSIPLGNLKTTQFNECLLKDSNFSKTSLSVAFNNCSLKQGVFTNTPLKGIDLSTSDIEGIYLLIDDIKGATVSKEQAIALARLLEVNIV